MVLEIKGFNYTLKKNNNLNTNEVKLLNNEFNILNLNAMHLNSFWHLGIGLALVVICGYTNGRKHIVYLGVLNLALLRSGFFAIKQTAKQCLHL